MKPECEFCKEIEKETFQSLFGKELTDELLYDLFTKQTPVKQSNPAVDLNQMIQEQLDNMGDNVLEGGEEDIQNWAQGKEAQWMQEYSKMKEAKAKAWEQLTEKVKSGEIKPSDLPQDQLMQNFMSMIISGLEGEGLLNLKLYRHWMYPNIQVAHPEFTEKSEKIIARKVLEETFLSLKKSSWGSHEVSDLGYGAYPSHILREYDEFLHTFDMLDLQESLLNTAIRDPEKFEIIDEDLKARIPFHKSKSANVILIDASYSMRGDKFRGGIMSALAFREFLLSEYKEDTLQIIAYNQKPQMLRPGQIICLRPYGYTDIGQALDMAVEILVKEEGNKNIFLITDGEPTASMYRDQTPEESVLRASYMAGQKDISLNIVMLDKRPELKRICEKMAKLNGQALVTYVDDPLNLKEFMIKNFMDNKKQRREKHS